MNGKTSVTSFLTATIISIILAVSAMYMLTKLSQIIHKSVEYDLSDNEIFLNRRHLCTAACPGFMNCTDWRDCIFHQPDSCNNLDLRCHDEDIKLFSGEVLSPFRKADNWEPTVRTILEILVFLLAMGMLLMSAWCFHSIFVSTAFPLPQIDNESEFLYTTRRHKKGVYVSSNSKTKCCGVNPIA